MASKAIITINVPVVYMETLEPTPAIENNEVWLTLAAQQPWEFNINGRQWLLRLRKDRWILGPLSWGVGGGGAGQNSRSSLQNPKSKN